ncbi:MAG: fibronectin type III domain-containing protein [Lachnospiraceae bacterium]
MKTMKKSMKCLVAVFVMAMAFCVTGVTAKAAAPTNVKQVSDSDTSVKVQWTGVSGAKYYGYQVATDAAFTNIVDYDYYTASFTDVYVSGLTAGTTYYFRVGYGSTNKNCYANFSAPIEVVTAPADITVVKFIAADDTTATIAWDASAGASGYDIEYNNGILNTTATTYAIPIIDGASSTAKVSPYRTCSTGYKAVGNTKYVYDLSKLSVNIPKDNFGITSAYTNINVFYFGAIGYGHGYDLEGTTVSGKSYSFSGTSSLNSEIRISSMKASRMYKYRVRAYVTNTDGVKIYGNWSDYRYICNPKDNKYTTSGKKIKLKWSKLTGVSKIKIQISTNENSGYKTCATLSGKKTSYTISKYGKSSLKKGKNYYVKVTYQYKKGKNTYTSDVYGIAKVTVR